MHVDRIINVDVDCPSDDEIFSDGMRAGDRNDTENITENNAMNTVEHGGTENVKMRAKNSTEDECRKSLIESDATLGANIKAHATNSSTGCGLECESGDNDTEEGDYVLVAPDGGWGWMVVIASFCISVSIISQLFTVLVKDCGRCSMPNLVYPLAFSSVQ